MVDCLAANPPYGLVRSLLPQLQMSGQCATLAQNLIFLSVGYML